MVKPRAKGVVDHPAWTFLIDRKGIDRQRFEGNGAQHRVEIGRTQGIEDVPQAVII